MTTLPAAIGASIARDVEREVRVQADGVGLGPERVAARIDTIGRVQMSATIHLNFETRIRVRSEPGRRPDGTPTFGDVAAARDHASTAAEAPLTPEAMDAIAARYSQESTAADLMMSPAGSRDFVKPVQLAQAICHCDDCSGHGMTTCGHCAGHGSVRCDDLYCRGGRRCCIDCGGSGRKRDHHGRTVSCNWCVGAGTTRCMRCAGHGTLRCGGCGQTGRIACGTCARTGVVTHSFGADYVMSHSTVLRSSYFEKRELLEILGWMQARAPRASDGLACEPSFEIVPGARRAADGGGRRYEISAEATMVLATSSGTMDDVPFEARSIRLDGPRTWFARPFLDDAFSRLSRVWEKAKDPASARTSLGCARIATQVMDAGADFERWSVVAAGARGAVSGGAVSLFGYGYTTFVRNTSKAARRRYATTIVSILAATTPFVGWSGVVTDPPAFLSGTRPDEMLVAVAATYAATGLSAYLLAVRRLLDRKVLTGERVDRRGALGVGVLSGAIGLAIVGIVSGLIDLSALVVS